jgi:hypothetical protein
MFSISLSSCSRYNANFKFDQSVFTIHDSRHIFEISEDDHPLNTVGHPRPRSLMNFRLRECFSNAFAFPGVNSRAELVPAGAGPERRSAPLAWGQYLNKKSLKEDIMRI